MANEFLELLNKQIVLHAVGDVGDIRVKEQSQETKIRCLRVTYTNKRVLAFTLDYEASAKKSSKALYKQLSCLIASGHGHANKKCDFVFIIEEEDRLIVILGDLKSDRPDKTSCAQQLKNSELYIRYLESLAAEYHGLKKKLEFVHVIVHTIRPLAMKPATSFRRTQATLHAGGVRYIARPEPDQPAREVTMALDELLLP